MKTFILLLMILGVGGCSDLFSSLSEEVVEDNIEQLREKLLESQVEVEKLKSRNEALEKMSEERINKFWSMYE